MRNRRPIRAGTLQVSESERATRDCACARVHVSSILASAPVQDLRSLFVVNVLSVRGRQRRMKKRGKQNRGAAPAAQADAAVSAAHAVLSHEAHVLRILQSQVFEVADLGRAACVCRAWRAAVAADDTLFEVALRHESPALAAARSERVSCRALAASTRAALKVPRSRAPPWANAAAAKPEEWTLVADVFCESAALGGDRRNVFSVSFPLSALNCLEGPEDRDEFADPDFNAEWVLAVARDVESTERDVPSLDAMRDMLGDKVMSFGGERQHFLRLLALHVGGGAAVVCSRKPSDGVSNYSPFGGTWGSDDSFRGGKTMVFEPRFGTGPRLSAHLTLCPAPDDATVPEVCVLGFSRVALEKGTRYDGPDSDTERSDSDVEDEDEEIEQQDILRTLALGPLRWSP